MNEMRLGLCGYPLRGARQAWRALCFFGLVLTALLIVTATPGLATEDGSSDEEVARGEEVAKKGEAIVGQYCGRCHAIGTTGVSPNEEAPPFRELSVNYPVEDLAESLAEGIMSGHPDMPVFVFEPEDVDAIIVYLKSIQVAPQTEPSEPEPSAPTSSEG